MMVNRQKRQVEKVRMCPLRSPEPRTQPYQAIALLIEPDTLNQIH